MYEVGGFVTVTSVTLLSAQIRVGQVSFSEYFFQ